MAYQPALAWETEVSAPVLCMKLVRPIGGDDCTGLVTCVGTRDGKIFVVDLDTGSIIRSFEATPGGGPIWDLTIADLTGDGTPEIVSGGMDGFLAVHTLEGTRLWEDQCENSISQVLADDITGNGILEVASGSLDRTLRVLSGANGRYAWGQVFASGVGPLRVATSTGKKKKRFVAGGNDGTVRVFDGASGELQWFHEFKAPTGTAMVRFCEVITLAGSEGPQDVVVAGADGCPVRQLDLETGKVIRERAGFSYPWQCVPLLGDPASNPHLVISDYSFEHFKSEGELDEEETTQNQSDTPQDHSALVCMDSNFEIIWQLGEKNPQGKQINVETMHYCEPGKILGAGGSSGDIYLLDSVSGQLIGFYESHETVNVIRFHLGGPESPLFTLTGDDGGKITKIKWKKVG